MKFPVFDLHCDTALGLAGIYANEPMSLRKNNLHIDLERASTLGGYAQCFGCFTTTSEKHKRMTPADIFEREMTAVLREIEENSDKIRLAYSAKEVEENRKQGIMSGILTIEGPAGFDFNPELLENLYQIGFRITTLGWNEQNPLTGSCVTGGGLTEQGREFVRQAQRVGMVVDVSHISDAGFWDIMDITQKPIIASHSNARALWDIPRNLSDEMYLAICKTGGTAGINLYCDFLGEKANIDTVCNHIFHFLDLAGTDRHVSLGSDFDGMQTLPDGITGVQDYDKLADRLLNRGLSENAVHHIFWDNALGVIEKCSM